MRATRPFARVLAPACLLATCTAPSAFVAADRVPAPEATARRPARQGEDAVPRTALPIVLVGVMRDSAAASNSACLIRCAQRADRRHASMVQVGDTACDVAEIAEIRDGSVVIRNLISNRREVLTLPEPGGPSALRAGAAEPVPPPAIVASTPDSVSVEVPKAAVDHYLVNLSELLASAQASPRFRDDAAGRRVIEGFELRQVRSGSVVEKVGLREGDVIVEVNGETLDGLPAVLRLLGQAQAMTAARVTVLRGGQRMTFVLDVK